jgi:probable 2-oxoglutarate dehydrogenase E1 component DHKTD1
MELPERHYSVEEKQQCLTLLTQSECFDLFLHKKFPQLKRYGLEGAEGMMIAMQRLVERAAAIGIQDIVIGMPHRGRLNLLTGLLQLKPKAIFHKIKGHHELPTLDAFHGTGDVLSHLGHSVDLFLDGGRKIHCSLIHNPSHLEVFLSYFLL